MQELYTRRELIRMAASRKGLKLNESASTAYSEPVATFVLDEKLLSFLKDRGIEKEDRPDCGYKITTLVDKNPQEKVEGWNPSNFWNFKELKDNERQYDFRMNLCVGFRVDLEKRGIVLSPLSHGSFLSPSDRLPNFRMFKALVESGGIELLPVAHEIAQSEDGYVVVPWTDLGLCGICPIAKLFEEFARGNEAILNLARHNTIFRPSPYPLYLDPGDRLFVPDPAQPQLLKMWRQQLEKYRSDLVV